MSKTILIVNATPNPNETEALAYYSEHAGAILKEHGGNLIGKYSIGSSVTDKKLETNVMVMEFEDDKIITTLNNCKHYKALIPYRDKAFSQISINFATQV